MAPHILYFITLSIFQSLSQATYSDGDCTGDNILVFREFGNTIDSVTNITTGTPVITESDPYTVEPPTNASIAFISAAVAAGGCSTTVTDCVYVLYSSAGSFYLGTLDTTNNTIHQVTVIQSTLQLHALSVDCAGNLLVIDGQSVSTYIIDPVTGDLSLNSDPGPTPTKCKDFADCTETLAFNYDTDTFWRTSTSSGETGAIPQLCEGLTPVTESCVVINDTTSVCGATINIDTIVYIGGGQFLISCSQASVTRTVIMSDNGQISDIGYGTEQIDMGTNNAAVIINLASDVPGAGYCSTPLDCITTTPAPTTPAPTTPAPTTPAPTTPAPTTPAPTTPAPTTPAPTTPAPTTPAPTTPAPTTPAPTTSAPTTPAPTTPAPTTPAPTTPGPTTPAPTTPSPTTPSPTTPAPTTPVPITPAPVTPAPVTPEPTYSDSGDDDDDSGDDDDDDSSDDDDDSSDDDDDDSSDDDNVTASYGSLFVRGKKVRLMAKGCDLCIYDREGSKKTNLADCDSGDLRVKWKLTWYNPSYLMFKIKNKGSKNLMKKSDNGLLKTKDGVDNGHYFQFDYKTEGGVYYVEMRDVNSDTCPQWNGCDDNSLQMVDCDTLDDSFNIQVLDIETSEIEPIPHDNPDTFIVDHYYNWTYLAIVVVALVFVYWATYILKQEYQRKECDHKVSNRDDEETDGLMEDL